MDTKNPSNILRLPDGKEYEGRLQYDDDDRPIVEMAECGHCGFRWNDALITHMTPTPSGRCPNEYGHVHNEEDSDDPKTFVNAAIGLLETGDSEGCEGLIVVDAKAYRRLQRAVKAATGIEYGETPDDDEDE